jgi:hypothetical protein
MKAGIHQRTLFIGSRVSVLFLVAKRGRYFDGTVVRKTSRRLDVLFDDGKMFSYSPARANRGVVNIRGTKYNLFAKT